MLTTEMTTLASNKPPITEIVKSVKLLADPTRVKIILAIIKAKEDYCVTEIANEAGASQSATSHQLTRLEAHGILKSFRNGKMICYHLVDSPTTRQLRKIIRIFE